MFFTRAGEVSEWLKEHDWKSCMSRKGHRGFESLSLHHPPLHKCAMACCQDGLSDVAERSEGVDGKKIWESS